MRALKKKITTLAFILSNLACGHVEILERDTCDQKKFTEEVFEKQILDIDEKSFDNLCLLEKRDKFSCDEPDSQQACCDLELNLCCYNELGYVFCRWT